MAPYKRFPGAHTMYMCHLYADTHEELMAMVAKIGVNPKWIQYEGDPVKEHFDIAKGKRELAIKNGAIPTTWRDYGRWARKRREQLQEKTDGDEAA